MTGRLRPGDPGRRWLRPVAPSGRGATLLVALVARETVRPVSTVVWLRNVRHDLPARRP